MIVHGLPRISVYIHGHIVCTYMQEEELGKKEEGAINLHQAFGTLYFVVKVCLTSITVVLVC